MFIGHFALGFAAKRCAPHISLGSLLFACQFADLLWPTLVLLGVERVAVEPGATLLTPLNFLYYPYSHSLIGLILWGALIAVVYMVLRHVGAKAAVVIAALVLSHWLLDVLTHRPDMPILFADSPRVGLGLWNSPALSIALELSLFAAGVWLYVRSTAARDRIGSIGFWALIGFLLVVYAASIAGPPPPSARAVAWTGQAMWLLVFWGYWIDRHRHANN